MNGFKAYRYYLALKLHFTNDKFNVFENRGNVKGSLQTFEARNDSYLFEKLARRFSTDKECIQYFVANFAYNNDNMIYEPGEAEQHYVEWQSRKEAISRIFKDDLETIQLEIDKNGYDYSDVFNCTLNDLPLIIKLYLGNKITIETMVILNELENLSVKWLENASISLIMEQDIRKIRKLSGFVTYNKDRINKIFSEFTTSLSVGV